MPQTTKAQNLHPEMVPFQIVQDASNSKSSKPKSPNLTFPNLPTFAKCQKQQELKTNIPKCCLSKSSKLPQTAKDQNLHPKMLPLQNFQDASSSNSSKPTSQNGAFQIFQDAKINKSSKPTSQNFAFPNLPRCLKRQKLKNLPPKMMPFQIFQDASSSNRSKPTSQNVAFSNLPRCLKQQKPKTYIPKPYLSKSSKMSQTAKAQNLHPKVMPFQIFQDVSNSKSSKPTSQNDALQIFQEAKNNKSSKPSSQNAAFPNLPRCRKQQQLKT